MTEEAERTGLPEGGDTLIEVLRKTPIEGLLPHPLMAIIRQDHIRRVNLLLPSHPLGEEVIDEDIVNRNRGCLGELCRQDLLRHLLHPRLHTSLHLPCGRAAIPGLIFVEVAGGGEGGIS